MGHGATWDNGAANNHKRRRHGECKIRVLQSPGKCLHSVLRRISRQEAVDNFVKNPPIAKSLVPVVVTNRYSSLTSAGVSKLKPGAVATNDPLHPTNRNTIFESIVWKQSSAGAKVKKTRKTQTCKVDEYLYNGKTFSLDNFLSMQDHDVDKSNGITACLGRSPTSRLMRQEDVETRRLADSKLDEGCDLC